MPRPLITFESIGYVLYVRPSSIYLLFAFKKMGTEENKKPRAALWQIEFYNFESLAEATSAARKILIAVNRMPNMPDDVIRKKNLTEFKQKMTTLKGNKPSGPPISFFLTMDSIIGIIALGRSEYNRTAPYVIGIYGKDLLIKIYNR